MKIREIHRETFVKISRSNVFEFFSQPQNLLIITPPSIPLTITGEVPHSIQYGTKVSLKMKLYGFLPIRWQTEITEWNPPRYFVDVQPKGPYRYWKHQHIFEDKDDGTLIVDHLQYAVPGFILESVVHKLAVKPQLELIFDYRQQYYENVILKYLEEKHLKGDKTL